MKVIYVMENKINGKRYIGQTNNFQKRMNGHRSDANNKNSHSYNLPLAAAIRKYGWDNFNNYIIEEYPDDTPAEYINEREIFFINFFSSLAKQNGYNLTSGGQGCPKPKKTYKEKLSMSKIFSPKEIEEIQQMLRQGIPTNEILNKFNGRLTRSYLHNINLGLNFKNENWVYPLHDYKSEKHISFSEEEQKNIKMDISRGLTYKSISEKWNISPAMCSLINNGKQWHDETLTYPLCRKGSDYLTNLNTWVKDIQRELIFGRAPMTEIAKKHNKSYSTVKKINCGFAYRMEKYKYPLTSNRPQDNN